MRRILNFSLGFIVGGIISAIIVLLITPQSAEMISQLFKEAYARKRADLEVELGLDRDE
ncbi:MAG: hypothetical protein AAF629_18850 [Chloroflexota bacterium]